MVHLVCSDVLDDDRKLKKKNAYFFKWYKNNKLLSKYVFINDQ